MRAILQQCENLQHLRIYYFLVAETIFFLAASTISPPSLLIVISIAALATTVLFTLTNLKNYWRILWLIRKLEAIDPLYQSYSSMQDFDSLVTLKFPSRYLKRIMISDEKSDKGIRFFHTGWLFTWGLFWLVDEGKLGR